MGFTVSDNGAIEFDSNSPSEAEMKKAMAEAEKKTGRSANLPDPAEHAVEVASSLRETGAKKRTRVTRETGTKTVKE